MDERELNASEACWLDAPETPEPVKAEWEQGERRFQEDLRRMRLSVARHDALAARKPSGKADPVARPPERQREPRRQNVRAGSRRARAPASKADDDSPLPDVARLAVASTRLWAHVRRREAREKAAA
jgi:hypothetical protein